MDKKKPRRERKERNSAVIEHRGPHPLYNLYGLRAELFEELCCSVWSAELGIQPPDLYSRKRQKQFGIDVYAERQGSTDTEGISCKCYKALKKGDIETFAQEFLDHWETHWKAKNFKRFILCTSCDLSSGERRKEIEKIKMRFMELGITFEAWSQRIISNKLHRHPGIRDAFEFNDRSAAQLEGINRLEQKFNDHIATAGVGVVRAEQLLTALDEQISLRLDQLQAERRVGNVADVEGALAKLCITSEWSSLSPTTRARALRMRALVTLDADIQRAEKFLDEADKLAPDPESGARAMVVFRLQGPSAALALVSEVSKDAALLRAALLLEAGRTVDAEAVLANWATKCEHDAEWHRLLAHLEIMRGRASEALSAIQRAQRLQPTWLGVQESAGRVNFAAALPASRVNSIRAFPEPSDLAFVRQDGGARAHLSQALECFERVGSVSRDSRGHMQLALWKLACLSSLPDRQDAADEFCRRLLGDPRTCAQALPWAIHCGYSFDEQKLIDRLELRLREQVGDVEALQAIVLCALARGDAKKAAAALHRFRARNIATDALKIVELWESRVALHRGEHLPDDPMLDMMDRLQRAANAGKSTSNWEQFHVLLGSEAISVGDLYFGCHMLAEFGQWNIITAHVDRLLAALMSPAIVRLAAHALYHTHQYARVVEVLDAGADVFAGSVIPYELQRLKAYAAAKRGDLKTARSLAQAMLAGHGGGSDHQFAIDVALRSGDVTAAVSVLRQALERHSLTPKQLLRLVPSVATEEPDLARKIVRNLLDTPLDDGIRSHLIPLAYRLKLDHEVPALLLPLVGSKSPSESVIRPASIEEMPDYLRRQHENINRLYTLFQNGESPVHTMRLVS